METKRLKNKIYAFSDSQLNSYSQIFFSNNRWFGLALVIISFFSPTAGLVGFSSVFFTNFIALIIGIDKGKIRAGFYGFNSLLIGLGIGSYYQLDFPLVLIAIFAAILTLFITLLIEGWFAKYGLPFLSFSFLLGIWIVTLATRHYHNLQISEQGVYVYNEIVNTGGTDLLNLHLWFSKLPWAYSFLVYFKSLGAIFFQYDLYAGLAISIILFFQSRISWMLSLVGFFSAWYYYQIIGADLNDLDYGNIGFNFILTAIAIGGLFVVPSWYSFVSVVLMVPLIAFLISGSSVLFSQFGLSVYALPFNLVTILYLYVLKSRNRNFERPQLVLSQLFSPEKHVYSTMNYKQRFMQDRYVSLSLPFYGSWKINQAFDDEYTHKGDWKYAWDFVISHEGKEYQNNGTTLTDFFCYNKPILMPADGFVEIIIDGIPDNELGEINLEQNWGNTIVIRHTNLLFTQISHIKAGTFQVYVGQYVRKGEVLGYVGNSGRSPYPHLHFQVQGTPFVGSKTIKYPFGIYLLGEGNKEFRKNEFPKKNEVVENLKIERNLKETFSFIPGKQLKFRVSGDKLLKDEIVHWEVKINYFNETYLECQNTGAVAYFVALDNQLYFTSFFGTKKSALYYFYLGAYRIVFGQISGFEVSDNFPIHQTTSLKYRFFQDFIAPFYIYINPRFLMKCKSSEDIFDDKIFRLDTVYYNSVFKVLVDRIKFNFHVDHHGLTKWEVKRGKKRTKFEILND